VVLPEPDSPTRPSTEPRGTARSTRLTNLAQRRPAQKPGALRIGKTEAAGSEHDIGHAGPATTNRSSRCASDTVLDQSRRYRAQRFSGRSARGVAASSARV